LPVFEDVFGKMDIKEINDNNNNDDDDDDEKEKKKKKRGKIKKMLSSPSSLQPHHGWSLPLLRLLLTIITNKNKQMAFVITRKD
jgi:hypothetical protein